MIPDFALFDAPMPWWKIGTEKPTYKTDLDQFN
jgi:hypothetical protein